MVSQAGLIYITEQIIVIILAILFFFGLYIGMQQNICLRKRLKH